MALATIMTLAVMTLATSCHSGQGAAPAAAVSPGSGSKVLTHCATAALHATVDESQAGAAAGSTYYPVDFTNTSSAACTMIGYPGVSLVTAASGRQIGAAAHRSSSFGTVTVRLAGHGHAHAWLQVAEAANYPVALCRPTTARGLRVYPPFESTAIYVTHKFPACAADSAPLLTVLPVRSGNGTRGMVP